MLTFKWYLSIHLSQLLFLGTYLTSSLSPWPDEQGCIIKHSRWGGLLYFSPLFLWKHCTDKYLFPYGSSSCFQTPQYDDSEICHCGIVEHLHGIFWRMGDLWWGSRGTCYCTLLLTQARDLKSCKTCLGCVLPKKRERFLTAESTC